MRVTLVAAAVTAAALVVASCDPGGERVRPPGTAPPSASAVEGQTRDEIARRLASAPRN